MTIPTDPHSLYQDWLLTETQFAPDQLNYKETVFTIGNGYLSTRGSLEEGYPGSNSATLINGVYDDIPIFFTELANCPNWLPLTICVEDEEFRLDRGELVSYQRQLDLRRGLLSRKLRWRSPKGKTLDIACERFASQADQHVLALRWQITPIDCEGDFKVQAGIDGTPENDGFNHWVILDQGHDAGGDGSPSVWLRVRTRKSRIELGMATQLTLAGAEGRIHDASVAEAPTLAATFHAAAGQTVTLEKTVTVLTSREVPNPQATAREKLASLLPYAELLAVQERAWAEIWQKSDIEIEGNSQAQLILRYNLFQLLIAAPRHDDRVSIPAKTLSGLGYRGHIFWDTDFFIFPFFIFTQPEIARNLLSYRYHTLEGARRKATHYGYRGAMYAWESAATGDDVTPRWGMAENPYGEDVTISCSIREIHISSVVAQAIWWYWYSTQDDEWMRDCGAEIILDTALFWSSRVEYDVKRECWSILGVIGPDEYHDNVNNSAFTNRLVQWHLEKALQIYDWLEQAFPEKAVQLTEKLQLTAKRRRRWQDIAEQLWIPYDPETGLIEQFEGFFKLEDIDLSQYEPRTSSMQAILGIQGTNRRQVLKQPDVLMLLYLMGLSPETDYGPEVLKKNWEYYAPRTDLTYGSSLGPAIQGLVAAAVGETEKAYEYVRLAALVDLEDNRGNAADGIHAASCGNIWQAVIFGVAGVKFSESGPTANPQLPPTWKRLKFKLHWRGRWHDFDLQPAVGRARSEIRGFVFDLDGVITDTAEYHYQAWQKLADEEGLPFDRQKNEALRGLSRRDSLLRIVGDRQYSEAQLQEMMERKNRYYLEFIQNLSPANLLPGAMAFIDELRAAGLKIALGSGSKNARTIIDRLGIANRFDAIADGYSVQRSKPAPDLFVHAAEQLGLNPAQCVVVEDASAGIEAARAGGMYSLGLGPAARVGAADAVLPSLEGAHWAALKAALSR
jgi:beta-phosphoglucomutase